MKLILILVLALSSCGPLLRVSKGECEPNDTECKAILADQTTVDHAADGRGFVINTNLRTQREALEKRPEHYHLASHEAILNGLDSGEIQSGEIVWSSSRGAANTFYQVNLSSRVSEVRNETALLKSIYERNDNE